jgi:hypothetical protein
MKRGFVAAGATAAGGGLMSRALSAFGRQPAGDRLTRGDVAILRLLAAAEIIEAYLWQQYNELGGVNAPPSGYTAVLQQLDGDMPQYISDNTDDEISHRPNRDSDDGRNLFVGQALKLTQHDHLSKVNGQLLDGTAHRLERLLLNHERFGIEVVVQSRVRPVIEHRGRPDRSLASKPAVPCVPHNRQQPGARVVTAQR